MQGMQRCAAAPYLLAAAIEQARPQRLRHAGAAIRGGASADCDDQAGAARPDRLQHKLPRTVGGCGGWSVLVRRQQRQAGGKRHLHNADMALLTTEPTPAGRYRAAKRILHAARYSLAACSLNKRLQCAVAAVGERKLC